MDYSPRTPLPTTPTFLKTALFTNRGDLQRDTGGAAGHAPADPRRQASGGRHLPWPRLHATTSLGSDRGLGVDDGGAGGHGVLVVRWEGLPFFSFFFFFFPVFGVFFLCNLLFVTL